MLRDEKKLYHVFIDLDKAFDGVPRSELEWALRRQLVQEKVVGFVTALHKDALPSLI